jgi:hypothetical protein
MRVRLFSTTRRESGCSSISVSRDCSLRRKREGENEVKRKNGKSEGRMMRKDERDPELEMGRNKKRRPPNSSSSENAEL